MPKSRIMGTVGYMSPEQVRGERVDHRSDIFSFGTLVHEMLSGKQPFQRASTLETGAAILNDAPSELPANVPSEFRRIVLRCLEKDVGKRVQSACELEEALRAASGTRDVSISRRRWIPFWLALLGLAAAFCVALLYQRKPASALTGKDTIVLADFANSTGDPVFDDTLKEALTVALRQSPFLNILSDEKVGSTLRLMTRPPKTALTPEVAREVCQRAGSTAYIAGSIAALASMYVLGLKAVNCQSGETLVHEQMKAGAKERVLDALGDAAAKLRSELGESRSTVQKFDAPLALATTSSLDALRAYSQGDDERAIHLDPNFVLAYWAHGIRLLNDGKKKSRK